MWRGGGIASCRSTSSATRKSARSRATKWTASSGGGTSKGQAKARSRATAWTAPSRKTKTGQTPRGRSQPAASRRKSAANCSSRLSEDTRAGCKTAADEVKEPVQDQVGPAEDQHRHHEQAASVLDTIADFQANFCEEDHMETAAPQEEAKKGDKGPRWCGSAAWKAAHADNEGALKWTCPDCEEQLVGRSRQHLGKCKYQHRWSWHHEQVVAEARVKQYVRGGEVDPCPFCDKGIKLDGGPGMSSGQKTKKLPGPSR